MAERFLCAAGCSLPSDESTRAVGVESAVTNEAVASVEVFRDRVALLLVDRCVLAASRSAESLLLAGGMAMHERAMIEHATQTEADSHRSANARHTTFVMHTSERKPSHTAIHLHAMLENDWRRCTSVDRKLALGAR